MSCFSGIAHNPMISGMATGGMSAIPGLFGHHGGGGGSPIWNGMANSQQSALGQQHQPGQQPVPSGYGGLFRDPNGNMRQDNSTPSGFPQHQFNGQQLPASTQNFGGGAAPPPWVGPNKSPMMMSGPNGLGSGGPAPPSFGGGNGQPQGQPANPPQMMNAGRPQNMMLAQALMGGGNRGMQF